MNTHTIDELRQLQSMPLSIKIKMTQNRIREWIREYGEDGVYISFSGGKDSTVLLDIVRNGMGLKNIPAVFVNTGLEYPEIVNFIKTFDNVEIIRPEMNFKQVIKKYGYPIFSKEVAESANGAKRYLQVLMKNKELSSEDQEKPPYRYFYDKVCGQGKYAKVDEVSLANRTRGGGDRKWRKIRGIGEFATKKDVGTEENNKDLEELAAILNEKMLGKQGGADQRLAQILGIFSKDKENPIKVDIPEKDRSRYSTSRYKFLLDAPFEVSNKCCNVMKKNPAHKYSKQTGRMPITAQMAEESKLRTQKWLAQGCNAFDNKNPISNPMSFWTEQDVLQYIKEYNVPICSVYGDIVYDMSDECDGQISFFDMGLLPECRKLKTTGADRTGCMFCLFGIHMEKSPNRLERMKQTHPKIYEYIMKPVDQGGLGYKEILDYINTVGGFNIKY